MVALDLTVVVNHLLHHHFHHHHHHYHLLLHFLLGEVVYHLLHCHHNSHYHLHYHQVEELLPHLLVAEVFFHPFLRMVGQFPHPHHLVVVVDPHHPHQVGWTVYHLVLFIAVQFWFLLPVVWHPTPTRSSCDYSSPWC